MQAGTQTLLLSNTGAASGGFVAINNSTSSVLNVPANVTAYTIGSTVNNALSVTGAATINVSSLALQTQAGLASVLDFDSLNIGQGGLLSAALPSNVSILSNLFSSQNLTVNVVNNVMNAGTITAPGTLSINAGGSIVNQTVNNIQANINAHIVNLYTGAGSLSNSGLINAASSINVQTQQTRDLLINNSQGLLQSIAGVINIRDLLSTLKVNTTINWIIEEHDPDIKESGVLFEEITGLKFNYVNTN